MQTLLLNDAWDIEVDEAGNIATTTGSYATAQTAANAIRLFTNDAYFDRTKGIPHFDVELGKPYKISQSVLINRIYKTCMAVKGVRDCKVSLDFDENKRIIGWTVYVTDSEQTVSVEI